MPRSIASVVSSGKATLYELQTVYSAEDVYDFLEILLIDADNERKMSRKDD